MPKKLVTEEVEEVEGIEEVAYMVAIRKLDDNPGMLEEAWNLYRDATPGRRERPTCGCCPVADARLGTFVNLVNETLGYAVEACVLCIKPVWDSEITRDADGNIVCEYHAEHFHTCNRCDNWSIQSSWLNDVDGGYQYCDGCRDDYCSFCDDCDVYYRDEYADDHSHGSGCECEPHPLRFKILANSHGELEADERLLVELPEGAITEQAISAAITVIWDDQFANLYAEWNHEKYYKRADAPMPAGLVDYSSLVATIKALEPVWQAKRGNYTRRLSAALFKDLGIKLNEGLLSRVGSTIRSHTSMKNSWYIEFTRDLNQSAEAFYNSGSCWWGSESQSLCALKSWGGFALRTYGDKDDRRDRPTGRAWVQPLNEALRPTSDILGAHAYVVYNGYGELEGYAAARLVAYLTSKTYRKIRFSASYQYVNSGGYLIADQETCDHTTGIEIDRNAHDKAVAA